MKSKFNDATNLTPDDFYKSTIFTVDEVNEGEALEIQSTQPIQVRINGGPWQDVRSLDDL